MSGGWGLNVNNHSVSPFQSRCDCWVFVLINVFGAKGMFGLSQSKGCVFFLGRLINSKQSFCVEFLFGKRTLLLEVKFLLVLIVGG